MAGLVEVWWDRDGISPGNDFRREIFAALRKAALVVVIISPKYLESEYCKFELKEACHFADHDTVRLFPVRIDASAQIPECLQKWHCMEVYENSDDDWSDFGKKIREAVFELAAPTPLTHVFREFGFWKEEISERLRNAEVIWLQTTSGLGWYKDFREAFEVTQAEQFLLIMDPSAAAFDAVAQVKLLQTDPHPLYSDQENTPAAYRARIKTSWKRSTNGKVNLAQTEIPILSSVLIIDPPFDIQSGQANTEIPRTRPPVMFLELPETHGWWRPSARIFYEGEDKDRFSSFCTAFSAEYKRKTAFSAEYNRQASKTASGGSEPDSGAPDAKENAPNRRRTAPSRTKR